MYSCPHGRRALTSSGPAAHPTGGEADPRQAVAARVLDAPADAKQARADESEVDVVQIESALDVDWLPLFFHAHTRIEGRDVDGRPFTLGRGQCLADVRADVIVPGSRGHVIDAVLDGLRERGVRAAPADERPAHRLEHDLDAPEPFAPGVDDAPVDGARGLHADLDAR